MVKKVFDINLQLYNTKVCKKCKESFNDVIANVSLNFVADIKHTRRFYHGQVI